MIEHLPLLQAWVIGGHDEAELYVEECKQLSHNLAIVDKVHFSGHQDITEIFPKISLTVLSSVSEGLPLVILESFAAGVPVIATDVGACRQLIYGGEEADCQLGCAGDIVSIANPQQLADSILQLLTNEEKWRAAQSAAMTRVETYYDNKDIIKQYRTIYQETLAHGGD